jgi:hypothetical protein
MRFRPTFFIFNSILPLVLGGLIYICWRAKTIWMFDWFRMFGLVANIDHLRSISAPISNLLPQWIIYSLPDGLWVYSLTAFMAMLWLEARPSGFLSLQDYRSYGHSIVNLLREDQDENTHS